MRFSAKSPVANGLMSAKYRYDWLRLLFGSTVAGDMFQEKLDGVQ